MTIEEQFDREAGFAITRAINQLHEEGKGEGDEVVDKNGSIWKITRLNFSHYFGRSYIACYGYKLLKKNKGFGVHEHYIGRPNELTPNC